MHHQILQIQMPEIGLMSSEEYQTQKKQAVLVEEDSALEQWHRAIESTASSLILTDLRSKSTRSTRLMVLLVVLEHCRKSRGPAESLRVWSALAELDWPLAEAEFPEEARYLDEGEPICYRQTDRLQPLVGLWLRVVFVKMIYPLLLFELRLRSLQR
jgi:hypothetical protein